MPCFQELFTASQGKPIEYKGQTLVMSDDFPIGDATALRFVFETTHSKWRQGISLSFHGKMRVNGQILRRGFGLWQDTAPPVVVVEVLPPMKTVHLYNAWDSGSGIIHSKHNGAAMIVEELPDGRRYRCNDGFADEDFDDLVFRVERIRAPGACGP